MRDCKPQGTASDTDVTASIGVASFPSDAKTKLELLHLADEAMYAIKNTTRNGVAAAKIGILPPKQVDASR